MLFLGQQGADGTSYVTEGFLDGLALEVPGLNFGVGSKIGPRRRSQPKCIPTSGTAIDTGLLARRRWSFAGRAARPHHEA